MYALADIALVSLVALVAHGAPTPQLDDVQESLVTGPPGAKGSLYGNKRLLGYNPKNPITTQSTDVKDFEVAPGQSENADYGFYIDPSGVKNLQPIRGSKNKPTDPGPRGKEYEYLNTDLYAPPSTDSGSIPNAKWPMGLSHNRHGTPPEAGWARQQNNAVLPAATAMAGVDMRLEPNAYRELHWHTAGEWSLVLNGSARIASIDTGGRTFIDDVQEGDVWFFPSGVPHSIQALENGVEFLLVFDQGDFDESSTFLSSEMIQRFPKAVLAKDFRSDVSAFDNIPDEELYIFPGTPAPKNIESQAIPGGGPNGPIPKTDTYSYHFSQQKPYEVPGGSVKILDSSTFPIASNFAVALLTIEPGAMREIHWHTTSDEWNFWIAGQGRITIYTAPSYSQTFDYTAGDVGYIPKSDAHMIENTGKEPVIVLEVLQNPRFEDISVGTWLGLTPKQVVKDTLGLPDDVIDRLPKVEPYIVPGTGKADPLETNFTSEAL